LKPKRKEVGKKSLEEGLRKETNAHPTPTHRAQTSSRGKKRSRSRWRTTLDSKKALMNKKPHKAEPLSQYNET
jgi:hypothetical protein